MKALALFFMAFIPLVSFAADGSYERSRVQRRLELIETLMRSRQASLPEHQEARKRNLDHLHEYWVRGEFPKNTNHAGVRVPYFVDREGTPCAVGYLLLRSGKARLVERVRSASNHIYIDQIQDAEFLAWAAESGLTLAELELIQPSYEFVKEQEEKAKKMQPPGYVFDKGPKRPKPRDSDITGTEEESGSSPINPPSHKIGQVSSSSAVSVNIRVHVKNNEELAIEWGNSAKTAVPNCWDEQGCTVNQKYSHTYEKPGVYKIQIRKTTFDCKPEPHSHCNVGPSTISRELVKSVEVK